MKKFDDAPLPLFAWADARPSAQIVDFAEVAPRLPRRVLSEISETQRALWHLDRRLGLMAPTPVLPFSRRA